MNKGLNEDQATVARDIIAGLHSTMKHVSTLVSAMIAALGAFGLLWPEIRSSDFFVGALICFVSSLSVSLSGMVLVLLIHVSIVNPQRGLVRENLGTFVVIWSAAALFALGAALFVTAINSVSG